MPSGRPATLVARKRLGGDEMPALLLIMTFALAGPGSAAAQAPGAASRMTGSVMLENDYVLVSRNAAPCAQAEPGRCEDRVIIAAGEVAVRPMGTRAKALMRGQIALFKAGESYEAPLGPYFEVAIKPGHPPAQAPPETIPPAKNLLRIQNPRFLVYEERLAPGETRPRHSHS